MSADAHIEAIKTARLLRNAFPATSATNKAIKGLIDYLESVAPSVPLADCQCDDNQGSALIKHAREAAHG